MNQETILRQAAEAAQSMQMPQPQGVQPAPSPLSMNLAHGRDEAGRTFVVLTVQHLSGQNVFFLDTDSAEALGAKLQETARLARTGLEIAR